MRAKKDETSVVPAQPTPIELMQQLGEPINRPDRHRICAIHDGDLDTTAEAVKVKDRAVALALAHGGPIDRAIVVEALRGVQQASGSQSLIGKRVAKSRQHDARAKDAAQASIVPAERAIGAAKARLDVPKETVTDPLLGVGNRAQFEHLKDELQDSAAFLESAGIYDHREPAPEPWRRYLVEIVLAGSESLLLTRRISNASWHSPWTMALFVALSAVLWIATHWITGEIGEAIADHRERESAARALTRQATDYRAVAGGVA